MIIVIIGSIVASIFLFLSGIIFCDKEIRTASALIIVLGIIFLTISIQKGYNEGYKNGQTDAAQGIQKYHLTTRPKVWKKKEE